MVVVEYWRRLMRFLATYDGPPEKRQGLLIEAERVRRWCIQAMDERKSKTGSSGRDYLVRRELHTSTPRPERGSKAPTVGVVPRWSNEQAAVLKKLRRESRV